MKIDQYGIKFAIMMRAARTAIGWNQQEFADMLGVAKSTVARMELLDIRPKAQVWMQAVNSSYSE